MAYRAERGEGENCLPFEVADQRHAMKTVAGAEYLVIDTPARPDSDDLKELAKGCDLLILPTAPDILSLQPMLETARMLKGATYRTLLTVVPPHLLMTVTVWTRSWRHVVRRLLPRIAKTERNVKRRMDAS